MRFLFCLFLSFPFILFAQEETTISGKIRDNRTKEPLPYVSLGFKGFAGGTTSDFEGRFKITSKQKVDSLVFTYMGYTRKVLKINRNQTQVVLVELEEQSQQMNEAVIKPGINPALRIIQAARVHRKTNDQEKFPHYQEDTYTKLDVSLTNVSDDMKNNPVFKPLQSLFDTLNQMKNVEGKHIIPVMVSETYSTFYYQSNPTKTKEVIHANHYSGIGVNKNSYITDLLGGELVRYNLNGNFVRLLGKDFMGPIAEGSNNTYIYTLQDSVEVNGHKNYKIQLNLRRKKDLGFEGTIWIEDSSYAMNKVDLVISKESNINFINRIRIQQEWVPVAHQTWMTSKSRVYFDFDRMSKKSTGVLAGFYFVNSNFNLNNKKDNDFFDFQVVNDAQEETKDTSFWNDKRTEQLSNIEKEMFLKVDSVNNLPVVKSYIEIVQLIVEGHKRIGKLDWGPYLSLVSYNPVEQLRLRLGFKTNFKFSNKIAFGAYLAYGFKDDKFKYGLNADYIFDSKKWTKISVSYRDDYDVLGITNSPISSLANNGIFQFFNFFADKVRMNASQEVKINYTKGFSNYWSLNTTLSLASFKPVGLLKNEFSYLKENNSGTFDTLNNYLNTSITVEARWAYREKMITRGNRRVRLQQARLPILVMSYQHGFKGLIQNEGFDYDKISFTLSQHINTGFLGTADWWIYGGKVFGKLPYPLLDVARGNGSILYSDYNFSLMNFYEFISDQFVHASYVQHIEGLLVNRIPVLRNWKLRNMIILKTAYGTINQGNIQVNDLQKASEPTEKTSKYKYIQTFSRGPYVELGYGFENIFKLFSISFHHRLNYLNLKNERGVKIYDKRPFYVNIGLRVQF
jgi:hypothetical protein